MTDRQISGLRLYFYGLCMGTADSLPGVSGGTVALLLWIYGRLISAVSNLASPQGAAIIKDAYPPSIRNLQKQMADNDLYFLVVLGMGMVTAVVVVANLVTVLHEAYPVSLFAFFTGLIGASALILYRDLQLRTPPRLIAVGLGFSLAFLVSGGVIALPVGGYPAVFVAGAIAVSAMIIPGISGSLLLILIGQYVYLTSELSLFVGATAQLVTGGPAASLISPGTTVLVFTLGGIVGLFTIARVIRAALETKREWTLTFLVSLIAGSVRAPVEKIGEATATTSETTLVVGFWALIGAATVVVLDRMAGGLEAR